MKKSLIKKMEDFTDNIENDMNNAKKAVKSWKAIVIAIFIGLIIVLILCFLAFLSIYNWTEGHKIVFKPLLTYKIQIPFKDYKVIVDRIVSPIASDIKQIDNVAMEKIRKEDERKAFIERLYEATRFLESRVGFDNSDSTATHVYCQNIGKVNEVGYFPEGDRHFCFKNEQEQRDTLIKWFTKNLDGMTAQEALCLYVTGVRQPTCKRVIDLGL